MSVPPTTSGPGPAPHSARITASGLPVVEGRLSPSGLLTRFRAEDYETRTTAPAASTPRRRRIAAARLVLVRTPPTR